MIWKCQFLPNSKNTWTNYSSQKYLYTTSGLEPLSPKSRFRTGTGSLLQLMASTRFFLSKWQFIRWSGHSVYAMWAFQGGWSSRLLAYPASRKIQNHRPVYNLRDHSLARGLSWSDNNNILVGGVRIQHPIWPTRCINMSNISYAKSIITTSSGLIASCRITTDDYCTPDGYLLL